MRLELSAPSKTFLSGEYAVLVGGPALILNTNPRFRVSAVEGPTVEEESHRVRWRGWPVGSPGYNWLAREHEERAFAVGDSAWDLAFVDSHQGRGGFGASGAQFLLALAFTSWLRHPMSRWQRELAPRAVLRHYKDLGGGRSSGADILAQLSGDLSIVDVTGPNAARRDWVYADLEFLIIRLNNKIATHEHLATLDFGGLESLVRPAVAVAESYGHASSMDFLGQLNHYVELLEQLKLVAPPTLELLEVLRRLPWCRLAKGCGALGADTALVFVAKTEIDVARAFCRERNLDVVGSVDDLSHGLDGGWSWA